MGVVRLLSDHLVSVTRAWAGELTRGWTGRSGRVGDGVRLDLRYAWRSLARSPGFLSVAVVVIGLGIGATTTILSVANALLIRKPIGMVRPEELVTVHSRGQDGSSFHSFSYGDFRELRAAAREVDAELVAFSMVPASIVVGQEPELHVGFGVSSSYFAMLGTKPAVGRLLVPADDQGTGGARVMVLSHWFWRTRWAGDSSIVGRGIRFNGQSFTVVGVTEPGFNGHVGILDVAMWVPIEVSENGSDIRMFEDRSASWLEIIGRARGLSPSQLEARLAPVAARLGRARGFDWDWSVDARRFTSVPAPMLGAVVGFLGLVLVLASMVLLISSTNIAGVMVARALARRQETAVRLALGASRSRVIRHLITENLMVFLLGGGLGIALGFAATAGIGRLALPVPVPIRLDVHLDLTVLAASLVVALLAGLVFGMAPALQATSLGVAPALKDDGSARSGRVRVRSWLVTAQVAASALLIVVASLFVRALGKAGTVDIGFEPRGVHVTTVDLELLDYQPEQIRRFEAEVERRIAAIPGVERVGTIDLVPLSTGNQGSVVAIEGREEREGVGFFWTDFARVSPGYFGAVGVEIVRGRSFTESDGAGGQRVIIINQTLADRIWPGEDPVGKAVRWGQIEDGLPAVVVGVARNGKYRSLAEEPISMVYHSTAQEPPTDVSFVVKARPGTDWATAVRDVIHDVDPNLPIATNVGLEAVIGIGLLPNRVAAILASGFGAVGLILAMVGLYGVLSYLVVRRRREIGIRMALGAPAGRVRRLVLTEGLKLAGIGLGIGVAGALVLARLIRSLLFGLDSVDLVSVGGAAVLLVGVAALASDFPARRAAATEPARVLRGD
jgi:predicted permease